MRGIAELLSDELGSAGLVAPFDTSPAPESGYYLCYRASALALPKVSAFRGFLLDEVGVNQN